MGPRSAEPKFRRRASGESYICPDEVGAELFMIKYQVLRTLTQWNLCIRNVRASELFAAKLGSYQGRLNVTSFITDRSCELTTTFYFLVSTGNSISLAVGDVVNVTVQVSSHHRSAEFLLCGSQGCCQLGVHAIAPDGTMSYVSYENCERKSCVFPTKMVRRYRGEGREGGEAGHNLPQVRKSRKG